MELYGIKIEALSFMYELIKTDRTLWIAWYNVTDQLLVDQLQKSSNRKSIAVGSL